MNCRTAAATRTHHTSGVVLWAALALALALMLVGPTVAWASDGGAITLMPSEDGVYVAGASLTASFTTDGALAGNTPLSVSFVSTDSEAAIPSTYTILSATGTTYTARIAIPDLAPGDYTLVITGQEINGGKLTSDAIIVAVPTPTPLPSPTPPYTPLLGTQAHDVPSGPGVSGGAVAAVAAAVAGTLLAVSLALLIVPPLRRRGNRTPR